MHNVIREMFTVAMPDHRCDSGGLYLVEMVGVIAKTLNP